MSDLRGMAAPRMSDSSSTMKIVGALVIAALIGTGGIYLYQHSPMPAPKPPVSSTNGF